MKANSSLFLKTILQVFSLFIVMSIYIPSNVCAGELILAIIDHQKIDADLENFPVMLKLNKASAPDFFERIVSSPDNSLKFRVEVDTNNPCYVEKERWDYDNRTVILHVKIPVVSSTADTVLTLFYSEAMVDNSEYIGSVGSPAGQRVWDHHFTHVLHLSEIGNGTEDEYQDSAGKRNHGTGVKPPDRVEALIGYGQRFGSTSDGEYIQLDGADPDGGTEVTLEAVFKPDAGSLSGKRHIIQNPGRGNYASLVLRHGANLEAWLYADGIDRTARIQPGFEISPVS